MKIRPFPLYIWYDTRKWIPLLLIPLLRALFSPRDAVSIIAASFRDVTMACLLIGYSVWKWRSARYTIHNGVTLEQGLIFPSSLRVVAEDAASVEVECSPMMWVLGGRRVRINTAGLRRRADATLYLSAATAKRLVSGITQRRRGEYTARIWPVMVMSASGSNAAIGLLTMAPVARQISRLLGQQVPDQMYGMLERLLSLGLPPLLNTLANLFVISWGAAFLLSMMRNMRFSARREGEQLHLTSGLFTRRDILIECQKITALELRQTLFMRLFLLYTATITAAGYGREKGTRPVVVPAARAKELCAALDILLPDYPICSSCLRPDTMSIMRFIGLPLTAIAGALLPLWLGGVWRMVALIWLIGSSWWLIVRLVAFRRSGFGVSNRAVTMRYSRGLAFYTVQVPREVADCAVIKRSPFYRFSGTCTVELRCFGEKRRRHRVWALPYLQAKALVEKML